MRVGQASKSKEYLLTMHSSQCKLIMQHGQACGYSIQMQRWKVMKSAKTGDRIIYNLLASIMQRSPPKNASTIRVTFFLSDKVLDNVKTPLPEWNKNKAKR